jgi:hypothetical protein
MRHNTRRHQVSLRAATEQLVPAAAAAVAAAVAAAAAAAAAVAEMRTLCDLRVPLLLGRALRQVPGWLDRFQPTGRR